MTVLLAIMALSAPTACAEYRVIDGDTWVCDGKKIRGWGIQAPEMSRKNCHRIECIPGDPVAAKAALEAQLASGTVTYRYRVKKDGSPIIDPYKRLQGIAYVNGNSAFCPLLEAGHIIHKPDYDPKGFILAECKE